MKTTTITTTYTDNRGNEKHYSTVKTKAQKDWNIREIARKEKEKCYNLCGFVEVNTSFQDNTTRQYKGITISEFVYGGYKFYNEVKNKFEVFDTTEDCKNHIDEYLTV